MEVEDAFKYFNLWNKVLFGKMIDNGVCEGCEKVWLAAVVLRHISS